MDSEKSPIQSALLVWDSFRGHLTDAVKDLLARPGTAQQVFEWRAKEECVKENLLFNLFLFLQKNGGLKPPPAPPSAGSRWSDVSFAAPKQMRKQAFQSQTPNAV